MHMHRSPTRGSNIVATLTAAMPRPGMMLPRWESLVPLSRRGVEATLVHSINENYELILITAGSLSDHLHLIRPGGFSVLGEFDIRKFFARDREYIDCHHKTAFSHQDVWDSFLGRGLPEARKAVWDSIEAATGIPLTPGGEPIGVIIKCTHGLHRSQAVARFIGDLAAWRGLRTCVINSTVFSRRWCHEDFRALVKHPLRPAPDRPLDGLARCAHCGAVLESKTDQ